MTRPASLIAFALLGALLLPVGACKRFETPHKAVEKAPPPVEVQLGKVDRRSMPNIVPLLGNVVADRQSEVAANVAGRVVLAPIERGQTVKVGATLAMVDSKAASLSAEAAASQAELADTQSRQAHLDCERSDRLLAQGAIGQAEYDRQRSQCKAQEFQASAARAQAGLSAKLAADAIVRAPFSGVIGERYVNPGEQGYLSNIISKNFNLNYWSYHSLATGNMGAKANKVSNISTQFNYLWLKSLTIMSLIKIDSFGFLVTLFTILHLTSYGQTQMEMNIKAGEQYKKADNELNSVYQRILIEYASQPVFIKKFKTAQRLWVQLRDAELNAKFPGPDYYGTVEPMCQSMYLESLTQERIKFIKVWLNGIPEGDACNGSVKLKQ